jgi:GTP-binding protein
MLKITDAVFVKSIVNLKNKPRPSLPEFAFAGRSNVGKSSLINSLLNRKNFARVSKQPGKTRTINYYLINKNFYIVDLPGYGFARVPAAEKKQWQTMIENFVLNSRELKLIYVLIDALVGPKKNDLQLVEWLEFNRIPFHLIATKADRISKSKVKQKGIEMGKTFSMKDDEVKFFSAKNTMGKQDILYDMEMILNVSGTP